MPPVLAEAPAPATQPARVLLVDDDEPVLRVFDRRLRRGGHEVFAVSDASRAVELVGDKQFDVVLSDIRMPGMSGLDLLRAIRTRDLDVPVLLMTGSPEVETAVSALEDGALRYLFKPIEAEALERAVEQAALLGRLARVRREAQHSIGDGQKAIGDRAGLEARFQSALEKLWMAFQPIVGSSDGARYGHEALLRTDEPTLRNPGEFIETAIRLGRLDELGRTIRARVADAIDHRAPADGDDFLFVNLHTLDLLDETLFDPDAPLSRHARRVVLEITERASLDEVADVRARVGRLRSLGYRIAVDDLGAGYAGLTSFAQLEPDIVKLDMCLVRGCDSSLTKQKLVRSVAALCRDLGCRTVMEGIETEAERDCLVGLGGDLFQGYFFGRPARELGR